MTPKYDFIPNRGFRDRQDQMTCLLGQKRLDIRTRLGEFQEFSRVPGAPTTDYFVSAGVQVNYDENGAVAFVEVASPSEVEIDGMQVIGREAVDVYSFLRQNSREVSINDFGADVVGLSLYFYEEDECVTTVSCGDPSAA